MIVINQPKHQGAASLLVHYRQHLDEELFNSPFAFIKLGSQLFFIRRISGDDSGQPVVCVREKIGGYIPHN